ncbi:hypothetical protein BO71DRAFT_395967 [Aspergillus ellipticus CBS 707.79]|uniref:Uncharacterized protein n=1 Tax=Aspergillus ellipticus CBS 707.79 TaxID=1448320 RepID=A0A319DJL0_9EURO|nr:hypothetical protein BO71DRAFT_395967 [Aspergillus ellipticus CBS 707.79]
MYVPAARSRVINTAEQMHSKWNRKKTSLLGQALPWTHRIPFFCRSAPLATPGSRLGAIGWKSLYRVKDSRSCICTVFVMGVGWTLEIRASKTLGWENSARSFRFGPIVMYAVNR